MPSRNILKIDLAHAYYHIYSRGVNKQPIFLDDEDGAVFLNLLKRYLSPEVQKDNSGRAYVHLRQKIELLCYCLMSNHFHLLVYQVEEKNMAKLMKTIIGSYSLYFNKKYKRRGPLFESRYKASPIYRESYLQHITRYIHLNPTNWQTHSFSSIHAYLGTRHEPWLQPQRILDLFKDTADYKSFVNDYADHKAILDELKRELAK